MLQIALVALGGALGSTLRYLAGMAALRLFPGFLPAGTLFVNVFGSFVMGVFVEVLARRLGASAELRLFVATGILGGFTTFSSFSLDTAVLYERGDSGVALFYVVATVLAGIGALFAGLALARQLA